MNLQLKAVYFCATNQHRWGKGYTIADAKKNAGVITRSHCEYYVQAALFNDPTEEELKNLYTCIQSDSINGSAKYYDLDRTDEDTAMINKYHVGWLTVGKELLIFLFIHFLKHKIMLELELQFNQSQSIEVISLFDSYREAGEISNYTIAPAVIAGKLKAIIEFKSALSLWKTAEQWGASKESKKHVEKKKRKTYKRKG